MTSDSTTKDRKEATRMNNSDKKALTYCTFAIIATLGVASAFAPLRSINSGLAFLLVMVVFSIVWMLIVMLLFFFNPKMEAIA